MDKEQITGYDLSRIFFDWCFENPEKITPNHIAMYFFIIEHWNRMGQKDKFGLPMEMTKDAIGIKNYKTYAKAFNDLADWNFIKVLQKSKNQYSANVIALVKNTKANTKALSKASLKHSQKQVQSIVGIIKPKNLITLEPIKEQNTPEILIEKTEVKIEKPKSKKQPDALQFPFTGPEFLIQWNKLISLPKWKNKPLSAIQMSLDNISKYDEEFAINQIKLAIAGNWQGLTFPDTDEKFLKWKNSKNGQTFKNNPAGKLAGTYKAADELAREVAEKSKRFEERMQNS